MFFRDKQERTFTCSNIAGKTWVSKHHSSFVISEDVEIGGGGGW